MMAIPKAFMLLGLIPGTILMLLIASLTFFTLAGLIAATAATGTGGSYGALVRRTIGPKAQAALEFAVLANCYIMLVVFVVVLGDILIGSAPTYGGLLPEWTGINPESCFWMRRDVVLGAVSLAVLLPLAAMRSMERLAAVNIIGEWAASNVAALSERQRSKQDCVPQGITTCMPCGEFDASYRTSPWLLFLSNP